MNVHTVTVVTPCLDPGPTIETCLESVASQTYPSVEHIVIDGGSTDGTVERLERAGGIRWRSERDEGQADALRKGFEIATGGYLTWLNADDELLPDALEAAMERLLGRQTAGFVYGNVELRRNDRSVLLRTPDVVDRNTFWWENRIMQPGTVFTRDAYDRIGGMDTSLDLALDFDLWVRFLDRGIRGVHVDRTLAVYPVHERSKTGSAGTATFLEEEVRVYVKVGWERHATIALGRAAAHHVLDDATGGPHRLSAAVAALEHLLPAPMTEQGRALARGAARAEFVRASSALDRPDARPLFSTDVWRHPEPRRVTLTTVWSWVARVLRGQPTEPTVEQIIRAGPGPRSG